MPKVSNIIKILISYHKPYSLLKNKIFLPVHVGRDVAMEKSKDGKIALKDYNWLIKNLIGDNTGENISYKNREWCELTAIYWAWKNYDKIGNPSYIGFMHYRRFFEFDNYKKRVNKEKLDLIYTASEKVILGLLPIVDDFERAIAANEKVEDLEAIKSGFNLIYNKLLQLLKRFDVEEIAADVFVKVWNNFEDLKSETIRAYLAVLAKNQTIDYLRKNKREIPFEKIEMTDTINIEDETINHIEQEELKYAIDLLKPRSKELLLRFYFLYQSVSQISKEMNISETSCKTGLYRARTELKNIMYRKGYKDEK